MGLGETSFAVGDELTWCTVGGDPHLIDGGHEHLFIFPCHLAGNMPSRATVKKMENRLLVDEDYVALDLSIESVRKLCAAYVRWSGFGPFPANAACLNNLW